MTSRRSDSRFASTASVIAGAVAVVLVLVGTSRYGIAVQSDGLAYVSAAESVAEGHGFTLYDGRPLAGWPPLYPAMLAALASLGVSGATAARWLAGLAFGGVVAATTLLARPARLGRWETLFIPASLLLGVTMFDRWRTAMSEPLFMLLVIVCLGALHRHLRTARSGPLALATLAAGLGCLTRYAGLGLVLVGGLVLVLDLRRPLAGRIVRAAAFGAASVALSVPWVLRNLTVTGWPTGVAPVPSTGSFVEASGAIAETLGRWFTPSRFPDGVAVTVALLLLLVAAWALVTGVRRTSGPEAEAERGRSLLLSGAFTLGYTAFLLASMSGAFIDSELSRLLSPVLPTLAIVLAIATAEVRERLAAPAARMVIAGALALLLVWPARFTASAFASVVRNGAGGYATARWQQSELARSVRERRLVPPVYSNEPGALFVVAGVPALQLPEHHHPQGAPTADSALRIVRNRLGDWSAHVVLFEEPTLERYRYSEEDLRALFRTELVERRGDGAIYRIKSPPEGSETRVGPAATDVTPPAPGAAPRP